MPFYHAEDRESKEIGPGASIKTFWGERIHLSIVTVEPGGSVPRHSHQYEQAGTVLEGELVLGIGNEEKTVRPGDYYVIPPNVEHWVRQTDKPIVALDIFSPPRDDYKY
jgi:quercetin dioxygenase-like cupin family protein